MTFIHAAHRRPTSDVRRSASVMLRGAASRRSNNAANGVGIGDDGRGARDADLAVLIERAIDAIRAAGDRDDCVFGPYADLNSLVRAVTYHEGKLLELGVARLAAENPALVLMPPETALPIVPAAVEMLKRNDWSALEGLRLRSEVHSRASYVPDLFLVDRDRHSALILDVKRSLASYAERRLNALRSRMMAAALIAGDWLHIEGRVAGVSKVDVAIIDGSSERRDRASGVFALDEVGELIGVADAGEAMLALRANFAHRVQQEVRAACLRAISDDGEAPVASVAADDEEADNDETDVDPAANSDDDEPGDGASTFTRRTRSSAPAFERRPIVVGFARGGAP
jgi:hypothetical protein